MIGFGRKKLCDFYFTYNEEIISEDELTGNEDEIISVTDNHEFGLNRNLIIEGEIYEQRDLGFNKGKYSSPKFFGKLYKKYKNIKVSGLLIH